MVMAKLTRQVNPPLGLLLAFGVIQLAWTTSVWGQESEDAAEAASEEEAEEERFPRDHFGHRMQGGVGISAGTGLQFEIAYGGDHCDRWDEETNEPKPADEREESVCSHRSPVFMDFQLSFGVTEGLEVLVEYRLGLVEETYLLNSRPMAAGLGIRYYVSPLSRVKFSIGVVIDVDFTKNVKTDVAIRPIFGLQVEIVRWVGFFIQGSVNLNFVRSFGISLDGTGGFQFRFP